MLDQTLSLYPDIRIDCGECDAHVYGFPKLYEHLITDHEYKENEAISSVETELKSYETDDSGRLLQKCGDHGPYYAGEICPGCWDLDRQIDEWKEIR